MEEIEQKLNPELKAKWIDALRSGDYKQGTCVLYSQNNKTYCCLGVLGVVCGLNKKVLMGKPAFVDEYFTAGELEKIPKLLTGSGSNTISVGNLMIRNDGTKDEEYDGIKLTFPEIADYIDKNY